MGVSTDPTPNILKRAVNWLRACFTSRAQLVASAESNFHTARFWRENAETAWKEVRSWKDAYEAQGHDNSVLHAANAGLRKLVDELRKRQWSDSPIHPVPGVNCDMNGNPFTLPDPTPSLSLREYMDRTEGRG